MSNDKQVKRVEYGCCPVCNGKGIIFCTGTSSSITETCYHCNGGKTVISATEYFLLNPTTEVDKILDIDEAKHVEYWYNEFKVASKSLGEWIEKYCKLEKENEELKATYTEQTKGDVLFTTFDGVEIKDRGTDYYAVHDFRYSGMCNGMGWYHPETGEKYFSTKEAAYDYILRYKPVLCLNDCIVGLPKDLFNKIEQKKKQKLNQ